MSDERLGRRVPSDFAHVELYPARRQLARPVARVENTRVPLSAETYQFFYDQGREGACVGYALSILSTIHNRKRYDALWLYKQAQLIDEYGDTPPGGGTSVRAGFDVLRTLGHRWWHPAGADVADPAEGVIGINRWLTTVDEGRTAIAKGLTIVDGINWYDGFYNPIKRTRNGRSEFWIPEPNKWGRLAGGHCIVRPIASDARQAFGWINSWGMAYPWPVYISYESHDRLMREQGEAAIGTDR